MVDKYSSYSELAQSETEGVDYERLVHVQAGALVAVIAPHAGGIEPLTGSIAQGIAGTEFSGYCFKGLKKAGNRDLHITSHRFDEPRCVELVSCHQWVVAIHGCNAEGERAFLGGLDRALIADFALHLKAAGINAETTGHPYAGVDPNNICNRGKSSAGVQFELSLSFRKAARIPAFVAAVRSALLSRQNAA